MPNKISKDVQFGKIIFKGNFWDFAIKFILLLLLGILTFGLALPYLFYWQVKYFVSHLEIKMDIKNHS